MEELEKLLSCEAPTNEKELEHYTASLKAASRGLHQSQTLRAVIQGFDELVLEAKKPVNDSDGYGEIRQSEKEARIKTKTLFLIKHLQHFK